MTTLATLLAHAATGEEINTADGERIRIGLDAAARLFATVAADDDAGAFGSIDHDDVGPLPVLLEDSAGELVIVNVHGLRYSIDLEPAGGDETVIRLCEAKGCPASALGLARLARVCEKHLTLLTPYMEFLLGVPRAGDARVPGWEATAEADARAKRLDAWEREITEQEDRLAHRHRFLLKRLRRHQGAIQ
ncbi:hypothetical protein [Spirillospora sp. CA-294931]|uniref:hypothetical protein n=1 Tax=Spirillospora sp. CA-294931 TaxID=3240042 RepID=UPI003D920B98